MKKSQSRFKTVKQLRRDKKRTALFHVTGLTNKEVAEKIGVGSGTIAKWLREEDVQDYISYHEENVYSAAEKKFEHLYVNATSRLEKLIESKSETIALQAVNDVMRMKGKLGEKKHLMEEMLSQGGGMVGAFALQGPQAEKAMKFLENTREDDDEQEQRKLLGS